MKQARVDWPWLLAAAALAGLAMPPVHLLLPSFVFLAPAVVLIERSQDDAHPVRRQLRQGFLFGLVTSLVELSWLPIALWRLKPAMTGAAAIVVVLLAAITALLFCLTGMIGRRLGLSLLWVFPPLWIAIEWLEAHLGPFGFPRFGPATSLSAFPVFLQLADMIGSRGVDYLLTSLNAALGLAWLHRRMPAGRRLGLAAAGIVLVLAGYGTLRMRTLPQRELGRVSILQPNIGFREKWDRMSQDSAFSAMIDASRILIREEAPELIVWPEAAIADFFENRPRWREGIAQLTAGSATTLLAGGLDRDHSGREERHFNAAFLLGPSASSGPIPAYHKRHLVPWVEWLPRGRTRALPFDSYTAGDTGVVFRVGKITASPIICVEAAFPELARDDRLRGAEVIINLSNDAWVSGTMGPWQGPAHLVLRAIENRVGIVRAANTGPSQFIRPDGVVTASTRYGVQGTLTASVWGSTMRTWFTRAGDWAGPLSVAGSVLLIMAGVRRVSATTSPPTLRPPMCSPLPAALGSGTSGRCRAVPPPSTSARDPARRAPGHCAR